MSVSVRFFLRFPLEIWAGAQQFAVTVATGFRRAGRAVEIYSDERLRGPANLGPDLLSDRLAGTPYHRVPFDTPRSTLGRLRFGSEPPRDLLLRDGVNVVFLDKSPTRGFLEFAVRHRTPVLFLFHGIDLSPMPFRLKPALLRGMANRIQIRAALRSVRDLLRNSVFHYQVLNPDMQESLVGLGIAPPHVHLIPTAVPSGPYRCRRNDDRFIASFVGRLEAVPKGIDILRDTIRRVQRESRGAISWSVVGGGPDLAALGELRSHDNVRVTGFVGDAEKNAALTEANLLLCTSYTEPYSVVVIEALFSGLPVISTPTAGPRFLLSTEDDLGKIVSFRPRDLAEAIERMHAEWEGDKAGYAERKERRRALATRRYDVDRMIVSYGNAIDALYFEAERR